MESYTKNDRVVGYTDVDLNTIFKTVRTQESNYGNFLADLARFFYNSDCCVLNSGCIRNDVLIKKGKLKFSQVSNLINDALVQVEVPGKLFPEILEYSCSTCPDTYAGSFLLVSGLEYSFNCAKKPRVQSIRICGQPLDPDRIYTMTTKLYLSNGGDGYEWLKGCRKTID
jgi:5'-nucleotidase